MTCDLPTLLRQACENDFDKAAEDKVLFKAVLLQILCNFNGGTTQQVFSGSGDPTTQIPAFNAGVYYDYTNKAVWNWDGSQSKWV
jgi:hypothetical protein